MLLLGGLFLLLRPDTRAAGPEEKRFDVSIEDGEMSPGEISVNEGDRVTLSIESDEPIGVHGYDIERDAGPGPAAELTFKADLTGRFEIEDHETERELGELRVRPR